MGGMFTCLISGGNWNNASNAGVFAANLNNYRTNSNNNVGFRLDCGFTSKRDQRIVEQQGYAVQHHANYCVNPLFGRETEDQGAFE